MHYLKRFTKEENNSTNGNFTHVNCLYKKEIHALPWGGGWGRALLCLPFLNRLKLRIKLTPNCIFWGGIF